MNTDEPVSLFLGKNYDVRWVPVLASVHTFRNFVFRCRNDMLSLIAIPY